MINKTTILCVMAVLCPLGSKEQGRKTKDFNLESLLCCMLMLCLFNAPLMAQTGFNKTTTRNRIAVANPPELTSGAKGGAPLQVGDKLPEAFWQQEHAIYSNGKTSKQTLAVYKGKLLILKFWASWCSTCIGKFPLVDSLNRLDGIHVAMVTTSQSKDNLQTVSAVLQKHRVAQRYPLASIIDDGTLLAMFPYKYVPQYVWVDYTGRILAITNYYFFTADKVAEVLVSQRRMAERVKAKP